MTSAVSLLQARHKGVAIETRREWALVAHVRGGSVIEMADAAGEGKWRVEVRNGAFRVVARGIDTTDRLTRLLDSFDDLVAVQEDMAAQGGS